MPNNTLFVQTIEAIYASGLDCSRLPEALKTTTRLLGAAGACFEILDKPAIRHSAFCSVGLPSIGRAPYLEEFSALNPRLPFACRQPRGRVIWDYQILDEDGMTRNAFYAEFLASLGLRYCLGVVIDQTPDRIVTVSVQRTRKQGHVDRRECALMARLCPHYQRMYDVANRLRMVGNNSGLLENALEWLADGVALMRADGTILYVNDTLRGFAQRGDGLRLVGRSIEFKATDVRRRLEAALGAAARVHDPCCAAGVSDFPVPRAGGMPAYIVSMRPLARDKAPAGQVQAEVMMFVRDPLLRNAGISQLLQELFGLTNAEAHLTQALCTGATTGDYAIQRHVSLNTVYSHLKRIREKTGCKSVPELIRKFGELNVPLRAN